VGHGTCERPRAQRAREWASRGVALGHTQAGGAGNRDQGCVVLGRGGGGGGAGPRRCAGERGCRALGRSRPSRQGCGAGPAEFEWAAGRPREGKRARGELGRSAGPWVG
jgi:hypothetical protein